MSETTESPAAEVPETERSGGEAREALQQVDLQALAERVYRLLKEQARLERERLGYKS
jgi:ABC-type hemin transport system ATPase subunit